MDEKTKVIISSEIRIENVPNSLWKWARQNLTFLNPEWEKKERMGFWTGKTPKYLEMYKKDGDALVLPCGLLDKIWGQIDDFPMKMDFSNNGYALDSEKVVKLYGSLYGYQKDAVNRMTCFRFGVLQSPCGSGKTQMGIAIAGIKGRKTLWVTHTNDLLTQSYNRAAQYFDKKTLGKIAAGKVEIGSFMTFATVQTLSKLDLQSLKYTWDVMIVDECHRACGTAYSAGMFYKVISNLACGYKYGLTATAHRSDGLIGCMFALLGDIAYSVPKEAVADKTMQVRVEKIETGAEVGREAYNEDGTLNFGGMITSLCENQERNEFIADLISMDGDKSCLILSARTEHLKAIMELMPDELKEFCCYVDGKMQSKKAKAEREQAIEDMKSRKKRYLFASYNLAKEGLDIPCLEALYLTTPQKDYAVVVQSVGRVGRTAPGKTEAVCYDLVDDVPYCEGAFKQRKRHYKKAGCVIVE